MEKTVNDLLIDIFGEGNSRAYKARREHLKTLFNSYCSLSNGQAKSLLDSTVEADKAYCIRMHDKKLMRTHNSFVIHYLSKNKPDVRDIAYSLHIDPRTVYKDIEETFDRIMIFMYGVDGLKIETVEKVHDM